MIASYILVAALATFITLSVTRTPNSNSVSKLEQLESLIEERFIGQADATELGDAAANAMIASLDDRWSYYMSAEEYTVYLEQMNNAYVGVGITISVLEDGSGYEVMVVNAGGPAEEAGILVGDVIIAVEGQSVRDQSSTDVRNLVRGEEGTPVQITLLRDGVEMTVSAIRGQVQTAVATGKMLSGDVGLVTIENFDSRCAQETIAAVEDLLEQGAQKLILDVRNNPGGYAYELVDLLDYLLPEGEVFHTVDYAGEESFSYSDADCLEIPMVVLVNADSYSAAEFFAAALREYEAAIVIGEQTSGKGYFQNSFCLNDGSAVALSVGKYYTPNGLSLEGVGITPDVEIAVDEETYWEIYYGMLDPEEDPQIQAALAALN